MATIINSAEDCSIKKFMDCCYGEKYKVLLIDGEAKEGELKAAFELIYTQFIDLAELYQTMEFDLYGYITNLDRRIDTIKKFVALQREFINQFNVPFAPGFGIVKRYGHSLYWDLNHPDLPAFIRAMDKMQAKEAKYTIIRDKKVSELIEMRKKKVNKEHNILQSRKEFIMMLNRLQQNKFVIDKEKTSIEDLAVMVCDCREQQAEKNAQVNNRR